MKKFILALSLSTATLFAASTASAVEYTEGKGWTVSGVRIANPFDSKTWYDGADHEGGKVHNMGETVAINFSDPTFWMKIPNPKTHSTLHGAFLNPLTWAQFTKLETYSNMFDLEILAKWLEPSTYDVLLDPQTYAYWVQPGAYQHLINADHYAQLINPSAYVKFVDVALGNVGYSFTAPAGKELLDPSAWADSISELPETSATETDG